MPTFDVTGLGVIDAPPIVLDASSDSATVSIRFTDGVLWMPAGQTIQVTATFSNQGNGRTRLQLVGQFSPAVPLAGGQLLLDAVDVSIPFDGAALDDGRPVNATGSARWVLPTLATRLGVDELSFEVGASGSADATTFSLDLAAPVTIPNAFVQVTEASLSITVLPNAGAFELALSGSGGITPEGRTKVRSTLSPVFGSADPLADVPTSLSFRRRFHLADGAIPALAPPAGPAMLRIFPDWDGGAPPDFTIDLPSGLDLDLGLPELSVDVDETGSAPSSVGVRITDCGLHVGQLGSLPAFDLAGALELVQQGATTVLRLQPSVPGGVDLPGFVRFFLSRLRWLADAADLDQLADQLALSMSELEWEQLFRGLLTGAGAVPANFPAALAALLDQAISALSPGVPVERVVLIAFSAFEDVADDAYGAIWSALAALDADGGLAGGLGATAADILRLLSDVPTLVVPALEALIATLPTAFGEVVDALVHLAADGLDALDRQRADRFIRLVMETVAVAMGRVPAADLARIVVDLLVANDDPATNVSLPVLLGAPSIFDVPELELPAVPAILMSALGGIVACIPDFVPRLPTSDSLYEVMRSIAGAIGEGLASVGISQLFDVGQMTELLGAIIDYSADDLDRERMLLKTSRMPVLGAAVTIVAVIRAAVTNPLPWWELMGADIVNDPRFDTLELPAPGTPNPGGPGSGNRRYLIVSDVHRDKLADDRGFLEVGSIDHFTHNHDLYLRILEWADAEGYTVVEGGDGEELWYIRDTDTYAGPRDELEQIVQKNEAVYAKLRDLHVRGRFFRVKGNHDSYLDLPAVRAPLDAAMAGGATPFTIHDFVVIPGVKTLQDQWWGGPSVLLDLLGGDVGVEQYVTESYQRVRDFAVGLDSTRYEQKKPLIVAHGHQWDFWNCRSNELVGKMLSNLVGVPADQILDPFIDARGIAFGGEPVVNFANIAADLPVLDGWLAPRQAARFAHEIQHQSSADRLLIDDVMFMETVAALSATLGIVVPQPDDDGDPPPADPASLEHFLSQRLNQLCLGHTHYPQSQPFWDIESMLAPLGLGDAIRGLTSSLVPGWEPSLNLMRALYYNTGTAGWLEGVIWAIEISEQGHARLVFWTENSIGPETMDWELDELPTDRREAIEDRIDEIGGQVLAAVQAFGEQALGGLAAAVSISTPIALAAVAQAAEARTVDLGELLDAGADAASDLQSFVAEVLMSAFLRGQGLTDARTYTLRVPLPPGIDDALANVSGLLAQMPDVDVSQIPKLACGWLQIVRNLPFFGGFESRRDVAGIDDRLFWVVVSLLFQLPTSQLGTDGLPLAASADLDGDALVVTVSVG